jgi:hypothetical protein
VAAAGIQHCCVLRLYAKPINGNVDQSGRVAFGFGDIEFANSSQAVRAARVAQFIADQLRPPLS